MFFWRFIVLFGGDGPFFFEYDEHAQCQKSFIWHLLFLNNLVPWGARDNCMQWTWYLACDLQFYLLVPVLVNTYYHSRSRFWASITLLYCLSVLVCTVVIVRNQFSASFFTYKDQYWSVYYEKPWARLPAYLMGMVSGCSYFTYKHEQGSKPGPIR